MPVNSNVRGRGGGGVNEEIFKAITDLPAIVQAIFGSFVFWLLSKGSQKTLDFVGSKYSKLSSNYRQEFLYKELFQKKYMQGDTYNKAAMVCLYQAFGYFLRGSLFLGFGLALYAVLPLALPISSIGFIYYLTLAISWAKPAEVKSTKTELEKWTQIKEIEDELYGKPADDTLEKLSSLTP